MTTIKTAFHITLALVRAIDWRAVARRTANGLRLCWVAAQLLLALLVMARDFAWEHRAEIRQALAATIAALVVATEASYRAGCWARRAVEALSQRSVELLPQQPLPTLAPITATIQAARESLERLVRRLYPMLAAA